MTVLIIDTTTERGIIALGTMSGEIIAEKKLPAGFQNSDHLFPAMQELGVKATDLLLIICATGPGSYTGIRVGAVVAKTLSFTHKIPLVGVCTLEGFPQPALIDAKMGGAYILHDGKWTRQPLEDAVRLLSNDIVYTPNAALLVNKAPMVQWHECYPSAERYLQKGLILLPNATTNGELQIDY